MANWLAGHIHLTAAASSAEQSSPLLLISCPAPGTCHGINMSCPKSENSSHIPQQTTPKEPDSSIITSAAWLLRSEVKLKWEFCKV